ncbi:MAG: LLM class flavin-dependent oxidoreductase [Acidimicrobiales bacterium]
MSFDKPVRHMLDYLNILQPLLETGDVNYSGDVFTRRGEPMAQLTDDAPALMVAALGPQMLKIAGKRTDGTILWMVGEKTIESHIAPVINEAANSAGRPTPRILCSLPVTITDTPAPVRDFANAALKIYGELPSYRAMLDREGAAGPGDVALIGNEEQVGERLANIKAAGATEFAAVEFVSNQADAERTRAFLKDQIGALA